MKWIYGLAGSLALGVALLHAVLGGIDTYRPLMASDIPLEPKLTLAACWHVLSLLFFLSALGFFWAMRARPEQSRAMAILLGLFYLAFAGIFAGLGFLWLNDPLALPQWTLLVPIGLLSLIIAW